MDPILARIDRLEEKLDERLNRLEDNIKSDQKELEARVTDLERWKERRIGAGIAVGAVTSFVTAIVVVIFAWLIGKL